MYVLFCMPGIAQGQNIPWKGNDFALYTRKMPLADVLRALAENYDTAITVDPSINGSFSGIIPCGPPVDILSNLAAQYNLVTWFDSKMLYIYPASLLKHQVITLDTLAAGTFMRYLRNQSVLSTQSCEASNISGANAVDISGVPGCLMRIGQLASMLDSTLTKRKDEAVTVKVFPLKYAAAVDSHYQYRDQSVVVPGIVSVLRDMSKPDASANSRSPATQTLPLFAADPRQNAVIVRDHSANMANYRQLITQLDQRPQMIEISVKIIDVNAGDIDQLGIDWGAAMSLGGAKFAFDSASNNGNGSGFSTVISDTSGFMVRLTALEQSSQAYVLSQPSVVTLNNVQAIMDKNITFYTKLEAKNVAKLESVTAGSLLRVTPRLLDDNGTQKIMLNLNIQDSQQSDIRRDSEPLPDIQNAEIASQATLLAGQSLLLGGFKQDRQIQSQNKIPLLGDIPGVGRLFRSDTTQVQSVIRLFLIKASVVNNGISHG
ncbi:EscC/YscC/HrcC family type III secretion system outer membrane ring protein [Kosakonia sp. BYX6]|uniref:Type 3 secretion system secretin n=2 Tax=Kosakonia calanthes TaxID=3139408 RepID=A0ABZ3BAS3_9ENTR